MALLARIGGPADVAAHPDQATKLLRGISRRLIADDDVTAVVASAKTSGGVPLVGVERDALMAIADDAYRAVSGKVSLRFSHEIARICRLEWQA